MQKMKGLLISMLLLAGILAGCNGTPAENKGTTTERASTPEGNVEAPGWPRTFKDSLGKEIVIEKKPEKLAALWYFYPEILVALGEPPAASTEKEYLSSLSYLKGKLDSAEELGDKVSPSIEKILSINQSNVWNNLNAVKKGHVYLMDSSAITGGPLAIEYALQNITGALRKP
ncbi:hypothetical protein BRE01_45950 [Brevibacillus reuszeri]|uniref:Fe/B12 periplasmic-binding domain-containing protein n=1 Tax=Brevibacillus reuszeri TaxID=54915 RepID=A0A0K9YLC1_9BACL|nr:hypothetical protein [Brevibacillus reuszeri]KNB69457.1 hypothetical protein ADS79_26585 [Brevibacillus reuszeri]MED1861570.1 hypothetical protein [Brevibacillus reuszeri]GED70893.1 hypothetical protein BRE01_45950 [Brevibacillus reuszeri]